MVFVCMVRIPFDSGWFLFVHDSHIYNEPAEPFRTNRLAPVVKFLFYSLPGSGGYCSNFGIAGSIWSHGCASETKISICGRNQLGSSRVEARIPTNCGSPSSNSPLVIREPHSGQKPRLCFPRAMLDVKW